MNHLGIWINCRLWLGNSGRSLRFWLLNKLPGESDAAALQTTHGGSGLLPWGELAGKSCELVPLVHERKQHTFPKCPMCISEAHDGEGDCDNGPGLRTPSVWVCIKPWVKDWAKVGESSRLGRAFLITSCSTKMLFKRLLSNVIYPPGCLDDNMMTANLA